jgi:hypothetical protein
MLPDPMREALAERVANWFGTDHENLRKAALKLQDEGYGDDAVMDIIKLLWPAAYAKGYRDGFDEAMDA